VWLCVLDLFGDMRSLVFSATFALIAARNWNAASDPFEVAVDFAKAIAPVDPDAPKPNPFCIARHCLPRVGKCMFDLPHEDCIRGMACIAGCGGTNQTCIFQCDSEFENEVYDDMIRCFFNEHDCMRMPHGETFDSFGSCRGTDMATPLSKWNGNDVTHKDMMNVLKKQMWYVTKGLSHAYDCFDCQKLWWYDHNETSLRYEAVYKIHKPDGGIRWNQATYFTSQMGEEARFLFHADDYGGLVHDEDWRILAIDERNGDNPQWVALYYCGGAPGVMENYEGSCLLTPDGQLPTDPKQNKIIDAIYEAAGIKMECIPNNDPAQCVNNPTPLPPTLTV